MHCSIHPLSIVSSSASAPAVTKDNAAPTMATKTNPKIHESIDSIRSVMQAARDSASESTATTKNTNGGKHEYEFASYEWRRDQLLRMKRLVQDNKPAILQALYHDLRKEPIEATISEVGLIVQECNVALSQLRSWMAPRLVASPAVFAPARSWIEPRPLLGPACLIIGPCNLPFGLALQPAVGCLAAGNACVVKPSELTPHTAALLEQLVTQYFDPTVMRVVNGGIPETQALLAKSWGRILFTGSPRVGRIVAQAAAATLTPVTLELGGKNPAWIDRSSHAVWTAKEWKQVARRIIWTKFLNTGQICASIDYLIVPVEVVSTLVPYLIEALQEQYGPDFKSSELGRIVTPTHAQRLVDLIREVEDYLAASNSNNNETAKDDSTQPRIICGSSRECDAANRYVCPTILINPPRQTRVLQEEVFGPILPILTVSSRDEGLALMKQLSANGQVDHTAPLCLYLYTPSSRIFRELMQACPAAGSVVHNDALLNFGNLALPMGGIGSSGMGRHHGKYNFDAFSHEVAIMHRPLAPMNWPILGPILEVVDDLRFHPFGGRWKEAVIVPLFEGLPTIPPLLPMIRFGLSAVLAAAAAATVTTMTLPVLRESKR